MKRNFTHATIGIAYSFLFTSTLTGAFFVPINQNWQQAILTVIRTAHAWLYMYTYSFFYIRSVRSLNPEKCAARCVYFSPFNVLEGMDESPYSDSRQIRLSLLKPLGFDICPYVTIEGPAPSEEMVNTAISSLKAEAQRCRIPIDGIVAIFDSLSYSRSCGWTGHHYKDGLAYKFEDEQYETIFRDIEWTPTRSGEIAPVGIFDTVEIDGCEVSRATLHNLTFIKNLELVPGCRILVSKRNMIIPHIEENIDRGQYHDIVPPLCPCCHSKT